MKDCKKCIEKWERMMSVLKTIRKSPDKITEFIEVMIGHCRRAIEYIKEIRDDE